MVQCQTGTESIKRKLKPLVLGVKAKQSRFLCSTLWLQILLTDVHIQT